MSKRTKYILALTAAAFLLSGCDLLHQIIPTPAPVTPTVAARIPNVNCNKVSFYLDPALGDGFDCNTIPEQAGDPQLPYWGIYPEYTEITIRNYPVTNTTRLEHTTLPVARVDLFPVQRFGELLPDILPTRLHDIQLLISSGTWNSEELPFLPVLADIQTLYAQALGMPFQDGRGVRYLTQYDQALMPVNNQDFFYTFQGLTADNAYWVTVILPITCPLLVPDPYTLPTGYTQESFMQNRRSYLTDIVDKLNAQTVGGFAPNLNLLDSLVESINVTQ